MGIFLDSVMSRRFQVIILFFLIATIVFLGFYSFQIYSPHMDTNFTITNLTNFIPIFRDHCMSCDTMANPYANCFFWNMYFFANGKKDKKDYSKTFPASEGWIMDCPEPLPTNWTGVHVRALQIHLPECNGNFLPSTNTTTVANSSSLFLKGNWIYVCQVNYHFGHCLMEVLFPTFHSILWANLSQFSFVVDARYVGGDQSRGNLYKLLKLLGDDVYFLQEDYVSKGITPRFEKLLVGFKKTSNVYAPYTSVENFDWKFGDFQKLRDYVYQKNKIKLVSSPKKIEGNCSVLLLRRNVKRRIVNEQEVINSLSILGCTYRIEDLESFSVLDQVKLISTVDYMIGVFGTGMHQMMWLQDYSVAIHFSALDRPKGFNANTHSICALSKTLLCTEDVPMTLFNETNSTTFSAKKFDGYVNITNFEIKLKQAKLWRQLWL